MFANGEFHAVLRKLTVGRTLLLIAALIGNNVGVASAKMMLGPGSATTCGGWVEARNEHGPYPADTQFAIESWSLGFLSGMALGEAGDPLGRTDSEAIAVWLDNYCQKFPLAHLSTALYILLRSLGAD
jgi:hypothetical protein